MLRYTSQQRQFESKRKERKKWREKKGRTTKIPTRQGGHESISQLQSRYMENLNAKSHDPVVFRSITMLLRSQIITTRKHVP